MAAVGTLDSRFLTLVPRGSDLRRQLRCHGVPLAQDETWGGVLEEAASLLLCPLAVPLPSSLASPVACLWEPELSTPPALSHTGDVFGWGHLPASGTAGFKPNPAGL